MDFIIFIIIMAAYGVGLSALGMEIVTLFSHKNVKKRIGIVWISICGVALFASIPLYLLLSKEVLEVFIDNCSKVFCFSPILAVILSIMILLRSLFRKY